MRSELAELLVDPSTGAKLEVEIVKAEGDDVLEGRLTGGAREYAIARGIPRFVETAEQGQAQVAESFGYKWGRLEGYSDDHQLRAGRDWLVSRYGFGSAEEMRAYFGARRLILDAGCGAGFSTSMWMEPGWSETAHWVGADISAGIEEAPERLAGCERTHFVQADLMNLPFAAGTFDTIFSEGVLHHTPSTRDAFDAIARLLAPGGEIMFYVYRRKAPLREYADDYIRDIVSPLPPEEAWATLRPLTRLAQSLAELKTEVEVVEDVPLLGIKAGRYDVQRLVYWHFVKLYWREGVPFEGNNHTQFDWYHPRYAHRHTEEELRLWCDTAGLRVTHLSAEEAGFTVRAVR